MTAGEVLVAMAKDGQLADDVLRYLNHGMLDEWDCTLPQGLELGFGNDELATAAKAGLALAHYHEREESA